MRTEGFSNYKGDPKVRLLDCADVTVTTLSLKQAEELMADLALAIEQAKDAAAEWDSKASAAE